MSLESVGRHCVPSVGDSGKLEYGKSTASQVRWCRLYFSAALVVANALLFASCKPSSAPGSDPLPATDSGSLEKTARHEAVSLSEDAFRPRCAPTSPFGQDKAVGGDPELALCTLLGDTDPRCSADGRAALIDYRKKSKPKSRDGETEASE